MRIRSAFLPLTALLVLAGLLTPGCGILTAPVSVPANVAANTHFSLHGPVVDSHGTPLTEVILHQTLHHQFWTPLAGYALTDESKIFRVDQKVDIEERGQSLYLEFTHPGFHKATYTLRAQNDDLISTSQGDWKLSSDLPIVLYPDKPDATLLTWKGNINYTDYPRAKAINLDQWGGRTVALVDWSLENLASAPASMFYLTLTPQAPTPLDAKGELDARDVNLPAEITLHVTGPDNGFVPMATKRGYAPLQASDTAPTNGYVPTLTISRARLKEMRSTSFGLATGHTEFFFFRANNRYGKGFICWSRRVEGLHSDIAPAEFYFGIWMQPQAGDLNLTSYTATLHH